MAQNDQARRELYNMLKEDGYYNGDYSHFTQNIDNAQGRQQLFNMLKEDGYYNGSWDDFDNNLTIKGVPTDTIAKSGGNASVKPTLATQSMQANKSPMELMQEAREVTKKVANSQNGKVQSQVKGNTAVTKSPMELMQEAKEVTRKVATMRDPLNTQVTDKNWKEVAYNAGMPVGGSLGNMGRSEEELGASISRKGGDKPVPKDSKVESPFEFEGDKRTLQQKVSDDVAIGGALQEGRSGMNRTMQVAERAKAINQNLSDEERLQRELDDVNAQIEAKLGQYGETQRLASYSVGYTASAGHDMEMDKLEARRSMLNDAMRTLKAGKETHKSGGFWDNIFSLTNWDNAKNNLYNLYRGAKDVVTDPKFYTMGYGDLNEGAQLLKIKNKVDNGEELSDSEASLALAAGLRQQMESEYGSDLPHMYNAAVTTVNMVPFMAQIAMNPAGGIGSAWARAAVRKFGKSGAKAIASRVGARIAGDAVSSVVLASTLQGASTAADAINRHVGDADISVSDSGNLQFNGFKNGMSGSEAVYKAMAAATIENFTEEMGDWGMWTTLGKKFGKTALGQAMKRGKDNMFHAMNMDNVNTLIFGTKTGDWSNAINAFKKRTKWSGNIGEMMEEEYGIILNSIFTGDNKLSDLADTEQQIDIALGVGLFGGFMSGVSTAAFARDFRKAKNGYKNADRVASFRLTADRWSDIKGRLDGLEGKELTAAINAEIADMHPVEAKAVVDYFHAKQVWNGFNTARELKKVENADNSAEEQVNNIAESAINAGENAESAEELHGIAVKNAQAAEKLGQTPEGQQKMETLQRYFEDGVTDVDNPQIAAIIDGDEAAKAYFESLGMQNGVENKVENQLQSAVDAERSRIEPYVDEDGTYREIMVDGKSYVVKSMTSDFEAGDYLFVYVDENGDPHEIYGSQIDKDEDNNPIITAIGFDEHMQQFEQENADRLYTETEDAMNYDQRTVRGDAFDMGAEFTMAGEDESGQQYKVVGYNEQSGEYDVAPMKAQMNEESGSVEYVPDLDNIIKGTREKFVELQEEYYRPADTAGEPQNTTGDRPVEEVTESPLTEVENAELGETRTREEGLAMEGETAESPMEGTSTIAIDEDGEPVFDNASEDDIARYYSDNFERDDAAEFIQGSVDAANETLSAVNAEKPKDGKNAPKASDFVGKPNAFTRAKAEWKAQQEAAMTEWQKKQDAAQAEVDKWMSVRNKWQQEQVDKEMDAKSLELFNNDKATNEQKDNALGDSTSVDEFISREAYKYRYLWRDKGVKKGMASHLFGKDDAGERAKRLAYLSNKEGVSVEEAAHDIAQHLRESGLFGAEIDEIDVFNKLVAVLKENNNRGDVLRKIADSRRKTDEEQQRAAAEETDGVTGSADGLVFDGNEGESAAQTVEYEDVVADDLGRLDEHGRNKIAGETMDQERAKANEQDMAWSAVEDEVATGKLDNESASDGIIMEKEGVANQNEINEKKEVEAEDAEEIEPSKDENSTNTAKNEEKVEEKADNISMPEPQKINLRGLEMDVDELEQSLFGDVDGLVSELDGVKVKNVKVIGSRVNGNAREDSDLDVLVEYEGSMSEDALFNYLNEQGVEYEGVKVDFNPIKKGKSGSIEEFLARNSGYVKEEMPKEDEAIGNSQGEPVNTTEKKAGTSKSNDAAVVEDRKSKFRRKPNATKAAKSESKRLVSDDRMAQLAEELMARLGGLKKADNAGGIDGSTLSLGMELAVGVLERGATKFVDYASQMVGMLGDVVRPYLKAFYNGVRDMPQAVENGISDEMDSYETVSKINVATFDKRNAQVDIVEAAVVMSDEKKVEKAVKKPKVKKAAESFMGDLFGDSVGEPQNTTSGEKADSAGEPQNTTRVEAPKAEKNDGAANFEKWKKELKDKIDAAYKAYNTAQGRLMNNNKSLSEREKEQLRAEINKAEKAKIDSEKKYYLFVKAENDAKLPDGVVANDDNTYTVDGVDGAIRFVGHTYKGSLPKGYTAWWQVDPDTNNGNADHEDNLSDAVALFRRLNGNDAIKSEDIVDKAVFDNGKNVIEVNVEDGNIKYTINYKDNGSSIARKTNILNVGSFLHQLNAHGYKKVQEAEKNDVEGANAQREDMDSVNGVKRPSSLYAGGTELYYRHELEAATIRLSRYEKMIKDGENGKIAERGKKVAQEVIDYCNAWLKEYGEKGGEVEKASAAEPQETKAASEPQETKAAGEEIRTKSQKSEGVKGDSVKERDLVTSSDPHKKGMLFYVKQVDKESKLLVCENENDKMDTVPYYIKFDEVDDIVGYIDKYNRRQSYESKEIATETPKSGEGKAVEAGDAEESADGYKVGDKVWLDGKKVEVAGINTDFGDKRLEIRVKTATMTTTRVVKTSEVSREPKVKDQSEIDRRISNGDRFVYTYTDSGKKQYSVQDAQTDMTINKEQYDYALAHGGKGMSAAEMKDRDDENEYQQLIKWYISQYPYKELDEVIDAIENTEETGARKEFVQRNLPKLKRYRELSLDSRKRLDRITSDGKAYEDKKGANAQKDVNQNEITEIVEKHSEREGAEIQKPKTKGGWMAELAKVYKEMCDKARIPQDHLYKDVHWFYPKITKGYRLEQFEPFYESYKKNFEKMVVEPATDKQMNYIKNMSHIPGSTNDYWSIIEGAKLTKYAASYVIDLLKASEDARSLDEMNEVGAELKKVAELNGKKFEENGKDVAEHKEEGGKNGNKGVTLQNASNTNINNQNVEGNDVRISTVGEGSTRQQSDENGTLGEGSAKGNARTDGRAVDRRDGSHNSNDGKGGSGLSRTSESAGNEHVANPRNTNNNHAERGTDYAPKSPAARFKANLAAIKLMKQLVRDGKQATAQQMEVLRKFSGWGGLGQFINNREEIGDILTDEEYDQAVMSINSAYYTPSAVIDAMWDISRRLGFKGGNVLEGSAGIGNIIGLMPTDMSERSNITAVEIDSTTGNILKLLYPDADVQIKGFEKTKVGNASVDLAITNVPFVTGLRVKDDSGDKDLSTKFHNIHDFCIAKNVRKLRPGGIGIFISSSGTLDKSTELRKWVTTQGDADFISAFRLNNETFGGAPVTSDIIIIRRRVNGQKSAYAEDLSSTDVLRSAEYDTGEKKTVRDPKTGKKVEVEDVRNMALTFNSYFVEHPENMGGEMAFNFEKGVTRYPTSTGLFPVRGVSQMERLNAWAESIKEMDGAAEPTANMAEMEAVASMNEKLGEGVKEGSLILDSKGNPCVARMGVAVPLEGKTIGNKVKGRSKAECIKMYDAIKSALAEVLDYQAKNADDSGLEPLIKKLNAAYDKFTKVFGRLSKNTALSFLKNDVDFSSIAALEKVSETGDKEGNRIITIEKTDVFNKRVVGVVKEMQPKTIADAVVASIFKNGYIDTQYIADKLGMSEEEARKKVLADGHAFEDPLTGKVEVDYEYLSGNVRQKLADAHANNENGRYNENIKALERVKPMDIPAHLIEFNLGSNWIEPKLFADFIKEMTGKDVKLMKVGGTWAMGEGNEGGEKNKSYGVYSSVFRKTIWGTSLIEAAMRNTTISVTETHKHRDGTTETIKDKDATTAANNKVNEIRAEFREWAKAKMQSDPELAASIERKYNDMFNNYVPKSIPKSYYREHLDGSNHAITLYPHQSAAVTRAVAEPLLLAHEVGTGKTFTLISTAMEMRRLGTAKKPMIVVQNATVGQFVKDAKLLYPNAKVLSIEDSDRTAEGRKNFYAKIKYNDWDMIVVPQSVFERIPDAPKRQVAFVEAKIAEKMAILEQMKEDKANAGSMVIRQAEKDVATAMDELLDINAKMIEANSKKKAKGDKKKEVAKQNAAVRAQEMLDRAVDDVEDFDDMDVDAILVDEAHEYKHLGFATAMQRGVKGVDPKDSKKSQGVYLKCQAVKEKNNGRNVVFATGTPISNTAAEVWTFMKYLMPEQTMKDYGIFYFDDFVRNFGNISMMLEFTTNGSFKENNRFAGYVNTPELIRIWNMITDTVLTEEAGKVNEKIPEMEGGKAQDIFLPQSKSLRAIMKSVRAELEAFEKMDGKQKAENSHIPLVMYGIASKAAIDPRLVWADAPDEPLSKTNRAVEETMATLEKTKDYKGTVAIFCDSYRNKLSGFNVYEEIKRKLVEKGVPAEQVFIMKSGMSVKKKQEIFDKVNAGEIRVILGSTQTLGTGVNIQERLNTLIHMDVPNRPMDYTQRNGRILRQGNLHKQWDMPVRVLRFGVEDSLDVTGYQRLKTKGAIADSIMKGKQMLVNNQENRSIEEEEDMFGDAVATLSGSEFAMLKNQAEREYKKYENKKKQWEADQVYIANTIRRCEGQIRTAEEKISEYEKQIAEIDKRVPMGEKSPIEMSGKKYVSVAAMDDVFKEINKKQNERSNELKKQAEGGLNGKAKITNVVRVGELEFVFTTMLSAENRFDGGRFVATVHRETTYTCDDIGLVDVPVIGGYVKNGVEDIMENVVTGADAKMRIERGKRSIEENKTLLETVRKREGKPFEFDKELEEAKQKVEEYSELMQEELAKKEAKYAEDDVEGVDLKAMDSEEDDAENSGEGDEVRFARRPKVSASEYAAIAHNIASYPKKEFRGFVFTADNFYLCDVFDENDFTILDAFPIEGNEKKIDQLFNGRKEFVYETSESTSDYIEGLRRSETRTGRYNNSLREQQGTDRRMDSLVGGQSTNGRNDYGQTAGYVGMYHSVAEMDAMESAVNEVADTLNVPVRVVRSESEVDALEGLSTGSKETLKREGKGYYNTKSGEVVVYLANNVDGADAQRTVLHEIVGHKGLRQLVGEKAYNGLLMKVYSSLPVEERKALIRRAIVEFGSDIYEAVDEYLAEVAEKDETPTWWNRVVSAVREMLRAVGVDLKLSDNDVKYLVWQSKNRLMRGDIVGEAESRVMRRKLGIDGSATRRNEQGLADDAQRLRAEHWGLDENGVRFRKVEDEEIIKWFNEQPKITTFKTVAIDENGEMNAPMANELSSSKTTSKERRVKTGGYYFENLLEAEEHPEIIEEYVTRKVTLPDGSKKEVTYGRVNIIRDDGKPTKVAYDPYDHSSDKLISDQFKSAWERDNLVVIEQEVLEAEVNGDEKYWAENAQLPIGRHDWKTGAVGQYLPKEDMRHVYMVRYSRPKGFVSWDKVADQWIDICTRNDISVPFNVVPKAIRDKIADGGVNIIEPESIMGKNCFDAYEEWKNGRPTDPNGGGKPKKASTSEGGIKGKVRETGTTQKLGMAIREVYDRIRDYILGKISERDYNRMLRELEKELSTIVPVRIINKNPSIDSLMALGYSEDEAKELKLMTKRGFVGGYDGREKQILIFAEPMGRKDFDEFRRTFIHENFHAYLHKVRDENGNFDAIEKMLKDTFENADVRDMFKREYNIVMQKGKDGNYSYDESERPEEFLTYIIEHYMADGRLNELYDYATPFAEKLIDNFVKQIGYGQEQGKRGTSENMRVRDVQQTPQKVGRTQRSGGSQAQGIKGRVSVVDTFDDGTNIVAKESGVAKDMYERTLQQGMYKFQEAWQDSMLGLKEAMNAVMAAEGKTFEDVADWENAYMAENLMSSINDKEFKVYRRVAFQPILLAFKKLEDMKASKEKINEYLVAKHGLERNDYMTKARVNEKLDAEFGEEIEIANKQLDEDLISFDEWEAIMDDIKMRKEDMEIELLGSERRDFSGLTALTNHTVEDDIFEIEEDARKIVDDFEEYYDTTELWEAINRATQAQLDKQLESGMMSREVYEDLKNRYQYYIPLRGFDETTSDEVYDYLQHSQSPMNEPIKKANGRKSLADDPIATIGNMAESGIMAANRNLMKQKMLNFVENHRSDLFSVSDVHLMKREGIDGEEEWVAIGPAYLKETGIEKIEPTQAEFESWFAKKMEEEPDSYAMGKDKPNIKYRTLKKFMGEHQIVVKRAGKQYVITVNGDPRAAQAINGLTNPDSVKNITKALVSATNIMARLNTTFSPSFVVANLSRDGIYANSMVWAKESPAYAIKFNKNWSKSMMVTGKLVKKFNNGTLDMSKPIEKMFHEFMMNGGETGQTRLTNVEQYKGVMQDALDDMRRKKWNPKNMLMMTGSALEIMNQWAEDTTRFAAFMTSREMGRSVMRSAYDAKEISVNFNKKGAGASTSGKWEKGNRMHYINNQMAQLLRPWFMFFNAGVQGIYNTWKVAKGNKEKFTAIAFGYLGLGMLAPFIAAACGGDGDDDYWNLPEYVRRQNLCLYVGSGYVKIPLPIELRAIYGLGDIIAGQMLEKTRYNGSELAVQVGEQFGQVLPIDVVGEGGMSLVPSVLKPPFEAYITNKDWTGLPIYKEGEYLKNAPNWMKAYSKTDPTVVSFCEWMNEVSGGNQYKKGSIDLNPARMEHLYNGYLGGMGTFFSQTKRTMGQLFGDEELNVRNVPVANRFYAHADERMPRKRIDNEYYRNEKKIKKFEYELNGFKKEMKSPDLTIAAEAQDRYMKLVQSEENVKYEIWKSYNKNIEALNTALKESGDVEIEKTIYEIKDLLNKEMSR